MSEQRIDGTGARGSEKGVEAVEAGRRKRPEPDRGLLDAATKRADAECAKEFVEFEARERCPGVLPWLRPLG